MQPLQTSLGAEHGSAHGTLKFSYETATDTYDRDSLCYFLLSESTSAPSVFPGHFAYVYM